MTKAQKEKLDGALDILHWAISEYCQDHARDGLHVEKAWKLLLKETKSTVSRIVHPMADDSDVKDANDFLEVLNK